MAVIKGVSRSLDYSSTGSRKWGHNRRTSLTRLDQAAAHPLRQGDLGLGLGFRVQGLGFMV